MNEKYGSQDINNVHQPAPQRNRPARRPRVGRRGGGGFGGGGGDNKLATASMVLGIVTAVLCIYATCMSVIGVVTGILAMVFAKKAKNQNGGLMPKKAKIGLAFSAVGLGILALTLLTAFVYIILLFTDPLILESAFPGLESFMQILGFDFDMEEITSSLF